MVKLLCRTMVIAHGQLSLYYCKHLKTVSIKLYEYCNQPAVSSVSSFVREQPRTFGKAFRLAKCDWLKDARSVSFRSELFTSYFLTIFKQRNRLP